MNTNCLINVFLVDDDEFYASLIQERLELEPNVNVHVFGTAKELLINLYKRPDIVIIDYNLPDKNGIEVLKAIKKYDSSIAPILLSGQKTVDVVVEAYKTGTKRYIIKNENAVVELVHSIHDLASGITLKKEVEQLQDQIIDRNKYQNIIGESLSIMKVFRLMQKVEKINMPVLITGQSGTGKELVAQAIHYNSDRRRRAFVPVNVAAIPEDLIESELFGHEKGAFTGASGKRIGKFEEAHRGTIFLDEIGEMDLTLQTKLLRVLQESKVMRLGGNKEIELDIRIVAATNKDLWKEVNKGNFREDLYFRLQGFLIHLPPLKERGNDVILLAKHFANQFSQKQRLEAKAFHPDTVKAMMKYSWPGNVREIKSMIERALLISDGSEIMPEDLIFLNEQPTLKKVS